METPQRSLIVSADDFGLSEGVNRGIAAAHERGIVTSAGLMVRWPAATMAAAYGRANPNLRVGLHQGSSGDRRRGDRAPRIPPRSRHALVALTL